MQHNNFLIICTFDYASLWHTPHHSFYRVDVGKYPFYGNVAPPIYIEYLYAPRLLWCTHSRN